ncbi:ThuA domain-containing protein [Streptomyces tendae]|uniref:ThuA domain-containing protein n=1 Tax=Streptomyces tendae TaxID=1932 RepID=UPI0036AD73C9
MSRRTPRTPRHLTALALTAACALLLPAGPAHAGGTRAEAAFDVLVFSKTAGFRHDSIAAGISTLRALGDRNDFSVTATEDAAAFDPAALAPYEAVVFLNTTGDVLDDAQQNALRSYVDNGGGYLGVHAAADTEYDWPYYHQLVGAHFKSHPAVQQATVKNEDRVHPATAHLDPTWTRTDEWYDYRTNPRPEVHVLQTLDESTYDGGAMGADHPITWCHPQGEGRSFYTGLGHTAESYDDPAFRNLLLGAVRYTAGQAPADCSPPAGSRPTEAETYTSAAGVQPAGHASASGGQTLGYIDDGDWAGYASLSTEGASVFTATVSSVGAGGTIEVRSGSPTGPLLGSVQVPVTGGWETFTTVSTTLTASAAGPLFLTFTGGSGALFDIDTFTLGTDSTTKALNQNVHLFYYPWYGSPAVNGDWRHWQQGGRTPPEDIGADLYPALGPYDSADYTRTVAQHMEWIARSGAGVLVYSWWGRGGYEDRIARGVLDAAQKQGIKVAWHLEPYSGRTAASTAADIRYINTSYGDHPAFYRSAEHGGKGAFYVFSSLDITDWTALDEVTGDSIVLAQTTDTSKIQHFSGMYTYDGIAGATAPGWKQAGDYARAHDLVWSPSVAPGYIDDRAVPGNTTPTVDRADGAAYDRQWDNALAPATGGTPTWVSVTSFNEWHEGSSIEPADSTPPAGHGYQTYDGAYGLTGEAAETAYLDRTAHWAERFRSTLD